MDADSLVTAARTAHDFLDDAWASCKGLPRRWISWTSTWRSTRNAGSCSPASSGVRGRAKQSLRGHARRGDEQDRAKTPAWHRSRPAEAWYGGGVQDRKQTPDGRISRRYWVSNRSPRYQKTPVLAEVCGVQGTPRFQWGSVSVGPRVSGPGKWRTSAPSWKHARADVQSTRSELIQVRGHRAAGPRWPVEVSQASSRDRRCLSFMSTPEQPLIVHGQDCDPRREYPQEQEPGDNRDDLPLKREEAARDNQREQECDCATAASAASHAVKRGSWLFLNVAIA